MRVLRGAASRAAALRAGEKKIGREGCAQRDSLRMDGAGILGGMNGGMVRLCSLGWLGARF